MPDRLALARRAYIDATATANAEFTATYQIADQKYRTAATAAAQAKTLVPAPDLDLYRQAINKARAMLAKATARVIDEVEAAITEARANGTYHWLIAAATCICGPDPTGEAPDTRPDCPACNTTRPDFTDDGEPPF